jgi:hypothetical protein
MLQNLIQKEIAKKAGVSHGLLRKWNTEEAFKKQVEENRKDFARFFITHAARKSSMVTAELEEYMNKPLAEMVKLPVLSVEDPGDEYRDADLYSLELINAIGDAIREANEKSELGIDLPATKEFMILMRHVLGDKDARAWLIASGLDIGSFIESAKSILLREVMDILAKDDLTEDDRRQALYRLALLRRVEQGLDSIC